MALRKLSPDFAIGKIERFAGETVQMRTSN